MRTLIYKRTHDGDPDVSGAFGVHDCMGRVRSWPFEAVVGVGGIGGEPRRNGIAGKLNWVGIGPHRQRARGQRGPLVTFDFFRDYGEDGPGLDTLAPHLAKRMYDRNVRALMDGLSDEESSEVRGILKLAQIPLPPPSEPEAPRSLRDLCRDGRVEPGSSARALLASSVIP